MNDTPHPTPAASVPDRPAGGTAIEQAAARLRDFTDQRITPSRRVLAPGGPEYAARLAVAWTQMSERSQVAAWAQMPEAERAALTYALTWTTRIHQADAEDALWQDPTPAGLSVAAIHAAAGIHPADQAEDIDADVMEDY